MNGAPACIRIHSVIDGSGTDREYPGEYAFKNNTHLIVYTDYTGNDITRCGLQADGSGMLLHRTGAFAGDMFFSPDTPAFVDYAADALGAKLIIHTQRYELSASAGRLSIELAYSLSGPDGHDRTEVAQRIEVLISNNEECCST